jgi:hypothetical protein
MGIRWPARRAFSKGAGKQRLVLFHQLVDQFAMGVGDRIEIRITGSVLQHFHHVVPVMRRQIEQQAFLAETLADVAHQARQIDVLGVDLVDHDHPRQPACLGGTHHALGGEFDAGLGVDHHHGGIDARQRRGSLSRKIRVARRIDEVDVHTFPGEVGQRRIQRVAGDLFLRIEIADGVALLHAALDVDRTRLEQQGFRQRGLAGAAVTDESDGAD